MFKKVDKLVLRGSVWLRRTGRIGERITLLTPLFADMGIELEFRPDL